MDFSLGKAQNAVNPFGLTSILTQHSGKSVHKKLIRIYLACLIEPFFFPPRTDESNYNHKAFQGIEPEHASFPHHPENTAPVNEAFHQYSKYQFPFSRLILSKTSRRSSTLAFFFSSPLISITEFPSCIITRRLPYSTAKRRL